MSSKELLSYAVLEAHHKHDDQSSYLDNFQQFVSYALACSPSPLTPGEISVEIKREFGLTIINSVIQKILTRGIKKKYFNVLSGPEPKKYEITSKHKQSVVGLTESMVEFRMIHNGLIARLKEFAEEEHPETSATLIEDTAGQLTAYIEKNAGVLLSSAILPGSNEIKNILNSGSEYIISDFISKLYENDTTGFSHVAQLVKGVILTSILKFDAPDLQQKLNNLTLILDSPLLLAAVGYRGEELSESTSQLIHLAKSCGAKVTAFPHSVTEAIGIIDNVAEIISGARYPYHEAGDVEIYFRQNTDNAGDVRLASESFESRLRRAGVSPQALPDVDRQRNINESELEDVMRERMHYRSDEARIRDVLSIAAVDQLRGITSGTFESSKYIFVTDNSLLAKIARNIGSFHRWPLAITTSDMASLLWVRNPSAAENLPSLQLLAVSHAGLQPAPAMWRNYLSTIEELVAKGSLDPDLAFALRTMPEAREILRRTTAKDDKFTEDTVEEVTTQIKARLAAPYESRLSDKDKEIAEQISQNERSNLEAREKIAALTDTLEVMGKQLRDHMPSSDIIIAKAKNDVDSYATIFIIICWATFIIALILIFVMHPEGAWAIILGTVSTIGGILAIFGVSIPSIKRKVTNKAHEKLAKSRLLKNGLSADLFDKKSNY